MTTVRLLEPGADSQTKDLNPHGVQHRLFRETATKFDLHLAKGFHWKHCARAWKFGSIGNWSKNGCGMFWDDSRIRHQELYILRIGEFLGGIPNITQPNLPLGWEFTSQVSGRKTSIFDTLRSIFGKDSPYNLRGKTHLVTSFVHVNFTLKQKITPFDRLTWSPQVNCLTQPGGISEASNHDINSSSRLYPTQSISCMLDQPPLTQHAVSGFLVTTRIFGTVFWATENPILNLDLPRLNPGRLTYPSSLNTKKCRPNFSKWPFKGHWKRKKLCANHWRRWEAQSRTNCTNKQKLLTSCWWPFFVRRFLQEVF